tara:strand:- start:18 stop:212 length:195 start_codon:yes stop_codon:yes gene_type:complete
VLLDQQDLYLETILVEIKVVSTGSLVVAAVAPMTPHHKLVKVVEVALVVLVLLKDLMQVVVMVE